MKIKILNNSKIDLTSDLKKVSDYFSTRLPFPLTFDVSSVNLPTALISYKVTQGFSPTTGQPAEITYYGLTDDTKNTCRTLVKENDCDILVFVWDLDTQTPPTNGVITSLTFALPLYQGTEYTQLAINQYAKQQDNIWKKLSHELLHCLCYKANRSGFVTRDEMDLDHLGRAFFMNDNPTYYTGNYAETLLNLQPYFNSLKTLQVVLTRNSDDGTQTLGTLTYGNFKCFTLERPWKNNIPLISCIPVGQYRVRWSFSPRLLQYTYEVLNVPNRSGIRIHSANFFNQLLGCIALGDSLVDINKDGKKDVLNSRATVLKFNTLLNKQEFNLTIL